MNRSDAILVLSSALALLACGPATPEAKVQERAALEFNCSEGQIQVKSLEETPGRRYQASGCGREAVYINAAPEGAPENYTLGSPTQTP